MKLAFPSQYYLICKYHYFSILSVVVLFDKEYNALFRLLPTIVGQDSARSRSSKPILYSSYLFKTCFKVVCGVRSKIRHSMYELK